MSGIERPPDDDVFSAYLDGELAPVEAAAFEARLAADPDARAELDDIAEVRTLVRGLGAVEPPAGFVDDLLAVGAADVTSSAADAEPGTVAPAADLAAARNRRRGRSRFAAVAVGAAAVVALVVAVAIPKQSANRPALATEVRVHQAGAAASGDPVSGLAPARDATAVGPVRRLRAAACAWVLGTVVLVGAGLPSRAADSSPADTLLDRARDAVATHEFSGVVRISWRNASGQHWKRVAVRAVDGGLRIAGGNLVEDDGRAWLRTQTRWETLWAGTRAPDTPSVGVKYTTQVDGSGPTVASRPTKVLTIERSGHVVERYAFDRENGLVLRRERFDDDGRMSASMTFVRLSPIRAASGTLKTPPVDKRAPQAMARPTDAHRRVGDGFVLVGAQRVGAETQLLYSDGVFSASVFTRDGAIDWSSLPAGGDDVRMDGTSVRRYRTAGGTVLTWESGDRTFSCVTDASDADQRAILASVDGGDDSGWTDAVRFVTSPFSWF